MSATVTASYTAPNGNRIVALAYQGRSYTVRQTPKLTTTAWLGNVRVTKKDHPGAFYDLVQAAYAEWERIAQAAAHPGAKPRTLGQMTAGEREVVVGRAVARFQAELTASAPALARALAEGDAEPECPMCRYLTGHTSWCPLAD